MTLNPQLQIDLSTSLKLNIHLHLSIGGWKPKPDSPHMDGLVVPTASHKVSPKRKLQLQAEEDEG